MTESVPRSERDHVRDLARRVADLAREERNAEIRKRWRDVNALRKPDRAPVWCRPVGCWGELLPEGALVCTDGWLRGVERRLRMVLVKRDIGDDEPIDETFAVPAQFDIDPPNRYGVDIARHAAPQAGGAWLYDPPLKAEADFDRLRLPTVTYNAERTARQLERCHDLLGNLLPVRLECHPPITATLCTPAVELRGLTETLLDAAAEPRLLHRLMAYVRDWMLHALDQVEATGLLTPNNTGPMTESDPIAPDFPDSGVPRLRCLQPCSSQTSGGRGPADPPRGAPGEGRGETPLRHTGGTPVPRVVDRPLTARDLWIHGNSQEFDPISPAMFEEFLLAYQRPLFERFGLVHYGCCENLTRKIDAVLSIPNLRIFTCSAWTDLGTVIDRCGGRYVIMWRQKASDVVFAADTETIRRDLDEGARRLRGTHYQIVLRELQTLAGHPDRLHVWTRHAIAAAEKHAS